MKRLTDSELPPLDDVLDLLGACEESRTRLLGVGHDYRLAFRLAAWDEIAWFVLHANERMQSCGHCAGQEAIQEALEDALGEDPWLREHASLGELLIDHLPCVENRRSVAHIINAELMMDLVRALVYLGEIPRWK